MKNLRVRSGITVLFLSAVFSWQSCSHESPTTVPCRINMIYWVNDPIYGFIYDDAGMIYQVRNYKLSSIVHNYWEYYRQNGKTVKMEIVGPTSGGITRIIFEYEGDQLKVLSFHYYGQGFWQESQRKIFQYDSQGKISTIEKRTQNGQKLVQTTYLTWQGNDLITYIRKDEEDGNIYTTTQTFDTTHLSWQYSLGNDILWLEELPPSEHVLTGYSTVLNSTVLYEQMTYTYQFNQQGFPVMVENSSSFLQKIMYDCF